MGQYVYSFIVDGLTVAKDTNNANQVNMAAGHCYFYNSDNTFAFPAQSFTTSVANATYYLDAFAEGKLNWDTSRSVKTGYVEIATVTTDSNGNVSTITQSSNPIDVESSVGASQDMIARGMEMTFPKLDNGGMSWDIRNPIFGGKCDGGVSQSGSISSSAVVNDTTPSSVPVKSGHLVTWVGLGAAVGGGVTGATLDSSHSFVTITTASAHGLSVGQQVTIAGVGGAIQANGTWRVNTVPTSTTFTIQLNTSVFGAFTSGGTVQPTTTVFGYVSNPVISSGTLTFTIVTSQGGSTTVTIPTGLASSGTYYYGSDDTAAWNAAIAQAEALGTNTAYPVRVTWSGTSMVSSVINVKGNVLIEGDHIEYVNPDGTNSSSSLPTRGSIIRAHGNYTHPYDETYGVVLRLGIGTATTTGNAGASMRYGVVDAANVVQYGLAVMGSRNTLERVYGCNGIHAAIHAGGSNSWFIHCIAGQSNTGDGVNWTASDSKWIGGFSRQACYPFHINGGGTIFIGGGVHIFNGYNGGNEQYGNDVLIDASTSKIILGNVIFDGVLGPHVRIAPPASATISEVSILGGMFFQPTATGLVDQAYPLVELDTTQSGSIIKDILVSGWNVSGQNSAKYKSIINSIGGGTFSRISLGDGVGNLVANHYTGTRPTVISPASTIWNGSANVQAGNNGTKTFSGDGTTTTFNIPHGLSTTPNFAVVSPMNAASTGFSVTWTSTNIVITFATAPAAGTNNLQFSWVANI